MKRRRMKTKDRGSAMNTTKASPVFPEDQWILGYERRFHSRDDWLRKLGSGGRDTASLTLFCLSWFLYCAGLISCEGMIGRPDTGLGGGCSDRADRVVTL